MGPGYSLSDVVAFHSKAQTFRGSDVVGPFLVVSDLTAIQFASVYRRLSDLDELEDVVRRLREEPLPGADQMPFEGIATGAQAGRWPAEHRSLETPSDLSDPRSMIGRSTTTAPRATTETRREDA